MFLGRKTNIEIRSLSPNYLDTVFSTDWKETLRYNGVVWESTCSCNRIGEYPPCDAPDSCRAVVESIGSFAALTL